MSTQTDDLARPQAKQATSGPTVLLFVTFLALTNYAALLSVVPMWASHGGAGSVAVGGTTGVMMAATVATQMGMPWLFRILHLRQMMVIGAVLLGGPTPLYLLSSDITLIMVITVVRGIGFALVVVAGATLAADLAGSGKLSSSVSLYGVAAGLPHLGALAGGVWAVQTWGFGVVFWISGIACLASAALACALPNGRRGVFRMGSMTDVWRIAVPITLFLLTAAAFGAATTFLPLSGPSAGAAALALLMTSIALVVARLSAGYLGDRYGVGRLLGVWVLVCAIGLALMAWALPDNPALLVIGAFLLGAGFGGCQNDSLVSTVQQLGRERSGTASTIWNIAFDGGVGIGAVALGWVIGSLGYASGFFWMAVGITAITLLMIAWRQNSTSGAGRG